MAGGGIIGSRFSCFFISSRVVEGGGVIGNLVVGRWGVEGGGGEGRLGGGGVLSLCMTVVV